MNRYIYHSKGKQEQGEKIADTERQIINLALSRSFAPEPLQGKFDREIDSLMTLMDTQTLRLLDNTNT